MTGIDYNRVEVLFLDVGNTLISIDYVWVSKELRERGIQCDAKTLQRAEAAARPEISSQVIKIKNNPSSDERVFYFNQILSKLPSEAKTDIVSLNRVVQELIRVFFSEVNAMRLWSYVLPGTYEALSMFQALGFQMQVIGNADGTLEQQLIKNNLRKYFGLVLDSHIVQIEKPDPRIFKMALETTNYEPQEALYVGDIYEVDIVGAKSVGMQAILVDPFSDWDGVDCERVPDLLALAERMQSIKRNG